MANWHEISFDITEDSFLLEMETAEMSNGLIEAQRELFLEIVRVNYILGRTEFKYGCKKSLIPKRRIKTQINRLSKAFDKFGKIMVEHGILPVHTDPWITLKMSPEEKFLLKGGAIFSPRFSPNPRFLDEAVGD